MGHESVSEGGPRGWTFTIDEILPSLAWRVIGHDGSGHVVERRGGPDQLTVLSDAWNAARWVDAQLGEWQIEVHEDPTVRNLYVGRAISQTGEVVDHLAGSAVREDVPGLAWRNLEGRHHDQELRSEREASYAQFDQIWLDRTLALDFLPRIDELLIALDRFHAAAPRAQWAPFVAKILLSLRAGTNSTFGLFRTVSDDAELEQSRLGQALMSLLDLYPAESKVAPDISER
jgi:hypothetical protein